uniref:NADH-ubiquinone oxidoreductase chain 2 n=1 Tax=Pisolithus microcarpus TaxID=178872 RepID=A0A873QIF1_9AGAM|nr:NADH dehydrogenase subunit 2 [Pisolithus microcarpus]QPA36145.1 NADH dehydrogenase subunit 2 [Pisolithus microcarpus]
MIFISLLILIVAIATPSIRINLSPNLFIRLSAIVFIYAGGISFNTFYIHSIESGVGIYSGLYQVTAISQLIDMLIYLTGSLILTAWPILNKNSTMENNYETDYKTNDIRIMNPCTEYSLIVMFSTLGASLLISSADFISLYLSIELQSFGVYILSTLYRDSESATSAGLKYFLLGGLSSCLILLGIALIYSYSALTNFESLYTLISVLYSDMNNLSDISTGIVYGLLLILIGLLFKIAAAPLHNWAPDVYDNSPTIVTIWLTIMPKISILFLILEIMNGINLNSTLLILNSTENVVNMLTYFEDKIIEIKYLILISALLSIILGTIVGLSQIKIKRLLAYSTISHIGFMLLALAINTIQSTEAFIFYIIQYTLTNLNTFLILLALGYTINKKLLLKNNNLINSDITLISQLKGQFFSNPLLSFSLSICLFSMAGVPPLLGFFSKYFVLYSAIYSGYYLLSIIAILGSVISASYYLKIIKILYTEDTKNSNIDTVDNVNEESVISNLHSFLIASLTLFILLFLFKPTLILNSVQLLSFTIFNDC